MKKIMRVAFVAAFAAIAGYGIYTNQKVDTMSDLMLLMWKRWRVVRVDLRIVILIVRLMIDVLVLLGMQEKYKE